jgi:twinkle protein
MKKHETSSEFLRHEPCPSCGSKDNLARYTDGHAYCFGCDHYEAATDAEPTTIKKEKIISDDFNSYRESSTEALAARGITEETCAKFGVRVGYYNKKKVHFYPYYKDNTLLACKLRDKDKNFTVIGEGSKLPFFGQNLWSPGKMLVVTEGEIDCLTVSQVQGNKWPTVSVPVGAKGAARTFRQQLEWLEQFESVIIMFDMDEVGQEAAKECAEILSPGKAKIASLPLKDPNELLVEGRSQDIIKAIWNAKEFRPDGIISGEDLWEAVSHEEAIDSVSYPFVGLMEKTRGLRKGELVTVTAGSGIGKSAFVREVAHHLLVTEKQKVGMLMLEENPKRTALGLMGIHLNKPIHISKDGTDETSLRTAFDATVGSGNLFLYDHWGSSDIDNLISRVRFMARGLGCNWVVLDHLSIVVSGLGDGDERRLIDNTMTMLRTLVEETGIGLILVSHLKRPEGNRGHEEGASTSLSQLRGSHAIAQLSDLVIGLERNQQGDSPNTTTVRVLKNRFSGDTGIACELQYDKESGRLTESPFGIDSSSF